MSKKQLHWYARDVEAYGRRTAHLSMLEHGAYTLLLDHYYRSKGPLPANAEQLQRICRCTNEAEVAAVHEVISQFFERDPADPTVWRNGRADEEIKKSFEISDKRSSAASTRYANAPANAPANADTPTPTPTEVKSIPTTSVVGGADEKLTIVPNCPAEELVALYHACLPLNPACKVLNEARRGAMRARWRQFFVAGKYTTLEEGLAWWTKLLQHAATSKFLTGQAAPRPGRAPWVADIDFLFSPSGVVGLIEGKYHEEAA